MLGSRRTANWRSPTSRGIQTTDRARRNTKPRTDPRTGGGCGAGSNGFGGLGAFGKVTAINSADFTLESTRSANGTATAAPTTESAQTPAGSKYTRTVATTAKSLVIGWCVTVLGKADHTGLIAATSIILQPAVNGSCSSGFGGLGGAGLGGAGLGGSGLGGSAAAGGGSSASRR